MGIYHFIVPCSLFQECGRLKVSIKRVPPSLLVREEEVDVPDTYVMEDTAGYDLQPGAPVSCEVSTYLTTHTHTYMQQCSLCSSPLDLCGGSYWPSKGVLSLCVLSVPVLGTG